MNTITRIFTRRALLIGGVASGLALARKFGLNVDDAQVAAILDFLDAGIIGIAAMALAEMPATGAK